MSPSYELAEAEVLKCRTYEPCVRKPVFGVSALVPQGGGVAQWLGRRISDQGVPGSNHGRCTFRCGLEQVTFTLLSTG